MMKKYFCDLCEEVIDNKFINYFKYHIRSELLGYKTNNGTIRDLTKGKTRELCDTCFKKIMKALKEVKQNE